MNCYPVGLNIEGKKCLVVGGGGVGTRKVERLLQYKADVTVISKEFSDSLIKLQEKSALKLIKKTYTDSDLDEVFLVIVATDNQNLNRLISNDAKNKKVLCNIADIPDNSDFILPSIVNRGDLTITISTAGNSPAFAKKLRKDLAGQFGEEYAVFLELMGTIRKKLLAEKHDPDNHKKLFRTLIEKNLLELIGQDDRQKIDKLLQETLGSRFTYKNLLINKDNFNG